MEKRVKAFGAKDAEYSDFSLINFLAGSVHTVQRVPGQLRNRLL